MSQKSPEKSDQFTAPDPARVALEGALRTVEDNGWQLSSQYVEQALRESGLEAGDRADSFRRNCREDFLHHIEHLVAAMQAGTPQVFVNYIRWLRDLLEARSVPPGCLGPSLTFLERELRPQLPAAALPMFEEILQAGVDSATSVGEAPADSGAMLPDDAAEGFTQALLDSNRMLAQQILCTEVGDARTLFGGLSRIVQPAMYQVGRLWHSARISVADEHVATSIANHAIRGAYRKLQPPSAGKRKVILACTERNQHSMGLEMVSWVFEMAGWETIFLGANAPSDALIRMIDQQQPDGVGLSVSTAPQLRAALQVCEKIRAEFQGRMPALLLGGHVFHLVPELRKLPRADAVLMDVSQLSVMMGAHVGKALPTDGK